MGHIKGKRFVGVMAVGLLATAGVGVAMAQGGLSANLALSNTVFNQEVSGLDATGVSIFGDVDGQHDGDKGVARLKFEDASITDMCMTAPLNLPGLGEKRFQMLVPGENTTAENLVLGSPGLSGGMTLVKPQIGVDASQLDDGQDAGNWGLSAEALQASHQVIKATSIAADKLTFAGSKVSIVDADEAEC
ncbi:MAG TPA: hypothetical protein H9870_04815 [Candidatus Corynebacterium avicola]|uniref:Cholesterol esterase n=1 Tax=Candidatus Corynebacterium avicola TaxID=2838527 RepID=A0A9D1RPP9_9CORY|nr:hypothetical protein [Candidatus Corynebacterium avicola]